MKTCAKCGAENLQTAVSCRLCAVPLEEPEPAPSASGKCQVCQAINETGWLFCQQCGNRLAGDDQTTVPQRPSYQDADLRTRLDAPSPEAFKQPKEDHPSNSYSADEPAPPHNQAAPPDPPPQPQEKPEPHRPTEAGEGYDRDTRIVCDSCGAVQFNGGLFCTSCGEELSALALARKRSREPQKKLPSLTLITEGGQDGRTYKLEGKDTMVGRAEGEITFPHDGFMSSRHARIIEREGRYFLLDANSRNGTFIRINGEVTLERDDRILIGKQIFQFAIEK